MKKERPIEIFNSLIQINNDRIEGYEKASKETKDGDLKNLFFHLAQTSKRCNVELIYEIHKLGGKPAEGTNVTGKFFRAWMDLKAALTGNNRRVILDSCEFGEVAAIETYEKVLNNDRSELAADQNALLYSQYEAIKADRDKIINLQEIVEYKQ